MPWLRFLAHSRPSWRALFSFVYVLFHGFNFPFHSTPPCSYLKAAIKDICACCIYITHKVQDPTSSSFSSSGFCPGTFQNTQQFSHWFSDLFSLSFLPVLSIPLLLCQQCKAGSWPLLLWHKTTFLTQRLQSSAWSCLIHSNFCKSILGYVYARDFSSVLQYCCRV